MSKALTSGPRKSGIDIEFYDELTRLKTARLAATQTGAAAQPQYPELRIPAYLQAALPPMLMPIPRLTQRASIPAPSAPSLNSETSAIRSITTFTTPKLKSYPGRETMPLPRSPREQDAGVTRASEHSPNGYSSAAIVLPELPDDDGADTARAVGRTSPSPSRSSPRSASANSLSSAASSGNSSPATTPRGDDGKEKYLGARKLQRKLTQKVDELAAAVHEAFKPSNRHSPTASSERGSPTSPASPRVRFGAVDHIDTRVNLDDPAFSAFVKEVADSKFTQPWINDSSDTRGSDGIQDKNIAKLKETFIRDFEHSDYFFQDEEGELIRLDTTDAFIAYIGADQDDHFVKRVSNVASQNLGNFLKLVLFLRHDAQKQSHSVLRLNDGTPIMPTTNVKARYTFSRQTGGRLVLDYQAKSTFDLNHGKAMRARTMNDAAEIIQVSDAAELTISMRATFMPDGQAELGNPHIQAKGWVPVTSS